MNLNLNLIGLSDEILTFIHIGKLESMLSFKTSELSSEHQKAILAILTEHVENMSTTELLEKLANRAGY
jgi:hypothetical protein